MTITEPKTMADRGVASSPRARSWPSIASHLAILVLLLLAPYALQAYMLDVLTQGVIYGLMAMALALLVGQVGLPSLGHAAFVGLGGYTAGLVAIHLTAQPLIGLASAVVVGAAAACLLGLISLRTQGIYFLMVSLAFAEIVHQVAQQSTSYAGGDNGLSDVPTVPLGPLAQTGTPFVVQFYWYAVIVAVVGYAVLRVVVRSPLGRAMAGSRDNQARMRAIGYSVVGIRMRAVVISGAVCAVGGALLLQKDSFVAPTALTPDVSVLLLVMVLIGGSRSLMGPFLAGVGLMIVRSVASNWVGDFWLFILGGLFVATVYLLPGGFASVAEMVAARLKARRSA